MSLQPTLFEKPLPFAGATYNRELDGKRLTTQFEKVKAAMLSGKWYTIRELQEIVGGSETGISARVRDLKKKHFGSYKVESERLKGGVWRYRISFL